MLPVRISALGAKAAAAGAVVACSLALAACGLVGSGVAVTSILRHSLISRIDQNLLDASRGWAQAPRRQSPPPYESPDPGRPPGTPAAGSGSSIPDEQEARSRSRCTPRPTVASPTRRP